MQLMQFYMMNTMQELIKIGMVEGHLVNQNNFTQKIKQLPHLKWSILASSFIIPEPTII